MDLGPFSTVFVLPRVFSISLSSVKRSSGERVVSTWGVSVLVTLGHKKSLTWQTPFKKVGWSSTYIGALW